MHLPKIEEIIASSYRSKDNKCTVQEKINWKLSQSLKHWKRSKSTSSTEHHWSSWTFNWLGGERKKRKRLQTKLHGKVLLHLQMLSFILIFMLCTLIDNCSLWSSISFKTERRLARYTSHFRFACSSSSLSSWIFLSISFCKIATIRRQLKTGLRSS
jgi:hypothetical protein